MFDQISSFLPFHALPESGILKTILLRQITIDGGAEP